MADARPEWNNIRLQQGERVIREYRASFASDGVVWAIASVFTLGLALPFAIIFHWARKQNRWAVTDRRLLSRLGVFNKQSLVINFTRVTDIEVKRPVMAQLFGNGRVLVNTAGSSQAEFIVYGQKYPDRVGDDIRDAMAAFYSDDPQSEERDDQEA